MDLTEIVQYDRQLLAHDRSAIVNLRYWAMMQDHSANCLAENVVGSSLAVNKAHYITLKNCYLNGRQIFIERRRYER